MNVFFLAAAFVAGFTICYILRPRRAWQVGDQACLRVGGFAPLPLVRVTKVYDSGALLVRGVDHNGDLYVAPGALKGVPR